MIQALTKHKGHLTSLNEDSKTAMVLGTLLHLPANWLWGLLLPDYSYHCQDVTQEIFIADYKFWPKWSAKGIADCPNTEFIEPDLFIRFGFRPKPHGNLGFPTADYNCSTEPSYFDVIIEAKVNITNPQKPEQWQWEIEAYNNHYNTKEVNRSRTVFIALDGNFDMKPVPSNRSHFGVPIFKDSWKELKYRLERMFEDVHIDNEYGFAHIILKDAIETLTFFGETSTKWLDDIDVSNYLKLEEY